MRSYSDIEVCENVDKISPSVTDRCSDSSDVSSHFDCNICLEESQDPVVTMCGHLFCWPCLYQWITIHSVFKECPVCKACIQDKIIPLYGRGKACFANPGAKDMHRSAIPHRPPFYPSAETNGQQYSARCGYVGQQNYGFVAQENYASEGAYFTSSAVSFGLFPALFGLHGSTLSLGNGGHIVGNSFNSLALRRRAIGSMPLQQVREDFVHRFILYWFLMLLAGFTISCFLLF